MMGSLNWPQEEWNANMTKFDLIMFSTDVKLKSKHTSNFQCGNVWLIQFCSFNVRFMKKFKMGNIYFFECDFQER